MLPDQNRMTEPTSDLFIDSDIRRAETLPGRIYHDPSVFERQKERIFARSWHFAADAARVRTAGRVLPFTLLQGCLDEPLLLTCDRQGTLHCLSNVCTHRGALVVEGEGHQNTLRCRYHGRRFGLDGKFASMPEFDEVESFPSPSDDLPRLRLERWRRFLFTSLDPAFSFGEWIEPVEERVGWMPIDDFVFDPATSRDYLIQANWALYCDNYLEEFHIPYVHSALSEKLDYGAYRTELFRFCNLQLGVAGVGEPAFDLPAGHPDKGDRVAAFYFWLFPNLMLNFYPWGLSVNLVQPLAPDRTRVSFLSFVWEAGKRGEGAGAELHRVEMEDEEVVESCQRGVRSRLYHRGRYSPRREVGTHHFHRLLAEFMELPEAGVAGGDGGSGG
jgi:choline monooxygenase